MIIGVKKGIVTVLAYNIIIRIRLIIICFAVLPGCNKISLDSTLSIRTSWLHFWRLYVDSTLDLRFVPFWAYEF